jgi:predicted transcriptional regulator
MNFAIYEHSQACRCTRRFVGAESFKQGMADAEAGRFVDMEKVLSGAPPPSRKRRK